MQKNKLQAYPIITRLKRMDFWHWCSYYIDLYRDCPYSCSYCNTQKISCFQGLNFIYGLPEEKETIGLGLISDIYTPDQNDNISTQDILKFLYRKGYSVNIMTKSDQILEDIHLLKNFSEKKLIRITFTILTLEDHLSHKLEGSSPAPYKRLKALGKLRNEGIPAGVSISPIIPCINDDKDALSHLIHECKKMGACWIIFSGFTMIDKFLKNPMWEKTAGIHADPELLRKRYISVKRFLLKLLLRESLPIRIPRITLNVFYKRHYSQIISELLFNISYLYELLETDIQMLRYRRAAYEINNIAGSLKSIVSEKKLGFIKGINPEIEKVVEEILYSGKSTLYTDLYQNLIYELE